VNFSFLSGDQRVFASRDQRTRHSPGLIDSRSGETLAGLGGLGGEAPDSSRLFCQIEKESHSKPPSLRRKDMTKFHPLQISFFFSRVVAVWEEEPFHFWRKPSPGSVSCRVAASKYAIKCARLRFSG
jgi:hypothetical protein